MATESFYYKECKITQKDLDKFDTIIRNNAYVVVKSKDSDFRLPISETSFIETYNPNATGRGAPILKDVKISLEGEAASLRRAELSFTCFDKTSFEEAENAFLRPGAEIIIEYGYVGPETPAEKGEYEFRVYDFSFKLNKQNYFECSLKAVAPGTGAEFDYLDINGPQQFSKLDLTFVTNYNTINETDDVRNLFDFMDYEVQLGCNELNSDWGSESFNPPDGSNGPCTDGGHWAVMVAPRKYEPDNKLKVGWTTADRIVYLSLEAIVAMINKHVLNENENGYQIKFEKNWSSIQFQHLNETNTPQRIWSPTPSDVLFPYAKGIPENDYGSDPGADIVTGAVKLLVRGSMIASGGIFAAAASIAGFNPISNTIASSLTNYLKGKISINQWYDAEKTDIETFRIDNIESDAPLGGNPKGIMISRDVLRGLQSEFNQQAMNEDENTEEKDKSKSTIPLIKFFKKIFGVIRENSGGDWDFSLEVSEGNVDSNGKSVDPGTIWIVNKKAPIMPSKRPEPLVFKPKEGKNGIRELSIDGSVPQDVQAEAFGGAPQLSAANNAIKVLGQKKYDEMALLRSMDEAAESYLKEAKFLVEKLPEAQDALDSGNYGTDVVSSAKGMIRRLVQNVLPSFEASNGKMLSPVPWPLKFKLIVDGIEGFRFGDTITCDYLPSRYTATKGVRVVFTVTEYTHTISGNDWKTEVTAVSRIVGD